MTWWTGLGLWLALAIGLAALLFSLACFAMIRQILQHVHMVLVHVTQFDPKIPRKVMDEVEVIREALKCGGDDA